MSRVREFELLIAALESGDVGRREFLRRALGLGATTRG